MAEHSFWVHVKCLLSEKSPENPKKPKWLLSMKYCSEFISILNYALIYKIWHTMKFRYSLLTVSTVSVTAVPIDGFINCNDCHGALVKSSFYIYFLATIGISFACYSHFFSFLLCQWFDFIRIDEWNNNNKLTFSTLSFNCASNCTVHTVHNA